MIRYITLLAAVLWTQALCGFDPDLLGKHFLHPQLTSFTQQMGMNMPANRNQFQLNAPQKGVCMYFGQGGFLEEVRLYKQSLQYKSYAGKLPFDLNWSQTHAPKQWMNSLQAIGLKRSGGYYLLKVDQEKYWYAQLKVNATGELMAIHLFPSPGNLEQQIYAFQQKVAKKWLSLDADGLKRLIGQDPNDLFAVQFLENPRNQFARRDKFKYPTFFSISKGVRIECMDHFYPQVQISAIEFFRAGVHYVSSSFYGDLPGGFNFAQGLSEQPAFNELTKVEAQGDMDCFSYSIDAEKEVYIEAKQNAIQRMVLRYKPDVDAEIRRKIKLNYRLSQNKDSVLRNARVIFKVRKPSDCISGDCQNGTGTIEATTQAGQVQRYTGSCKNGYAEGEGKVVVLNQGKLFLEMNGTFKEGKIYGKGSITSFDGDRKFVFEGDIKDNLKHGKGIEKEYLNDKWVTTYEGEFAFGKRAGQGKIESESGITYEGSFSGNEVTGEGTMTVPEQGVRIVGRFRKGEPNGHVTFYMPDGKEEKIYFWDGKRQGESVLKLPGGKKVVGYYLNDLKEGPFEFYEYGVKVKTILFEKGVEKNTIYH